MACALPREGSIRRAILALLPATNAKLADLLAMHSGEVARTMAALKIAGLVQGGRGRGHVATYALTEAATALLAAEAPTLIPVTAE